MRAIWMIGAAVWLAGCTADKAAVVDKAAEEAAIHARDAEYMRAVQAKDVKAAVALYAADGASLVANMPAAKGTAGLEKAFTEFFAIPGMSLNWKESKIEVGSGGDLAYSYGAYEMTMTGPKGEPVKDIGKYMTVWKKVDGKWVVAVDMNNSDIPLPGAGGA
jgi:uncharacterized protein (TIGR02246 family)